MCDVFGILTDEIQGKQSHGLMQALATLKKVVEEEAEAASNALKVNVG